jgi:hypothetical protein
MQTRLQWILMLLHVNPEAREEALKVYTVSPHLIEKCISSSPPSVPSLSTHAMMLPFLFRVLGLLRVSQSQNQDLVLVGCFKEKTLAFDPGECIQNLTKCNSRLRIHAQSRPDHQFGSQNSRGWMKIRAREVVQQLVSRIASKRNTPPRPLTWAPVVEPDAKVMKQSAKDCH